MNRLFIVAFTFLFFTTNYSWLLAGEPKIQGFEDPKLLERVLAGEIVPQVLTNTKFEYRGFQRAYAGKASPEAYIKLAINHAAYPNYFKEVVSSKTTKANAELTELEYWADVLFKQGLFTFHIYPEGKQLVTYGKDAVSESKIVNTITNYTDKIQKASEIVRLIPYEGGILIESLVEVAVRPETTGAATAQSELVKHTNRFMPTFRKALLGE